MDIEKLRLHLIQSLPSYEILPIKNIPIKIYFENDTLTDFELFKTWCFELKLPANVKSILIIYYSNHQVKFYLNFSFHYHTFITREESSAFKYSYNYDEVCQVCPCECVPVCLKLCNDKRTN